MTRPTLPDSGLWAAIVAAAICVVPLGVWVAVSWL